ncbi:helix-turn-helix domain-containing protein [Streptomyces sp. AK02-01A]|uniref:AraC-like ligand-binding domain-containing protein n=1 Tax=Streptomyces sp. AK02-01A TaxID=3028648 RepID=UPI0029A91A06|nr:helix-turn-helix domain-containing protein [Streptomyces sp. AK02-01A]MDX3855297.1 helix-turn-helix domain-containing protein [Streptomyces sp. AK02-01A]
MSLLLTTASVPDEHKIAYWSAAVDRTLGPLLVTRWEPAPLTGRIRSDRLGHLRVSTVESDPQRMRRTLELIKGSSEECVGLAVQARGTASLVQDGRSTVVREAEMVVYDTARPYTFDYPDPFRIHVIHLPRRALGVPNSELRQVTGTAISPAKGVAALLGPFLTTLADSSHSHAPEVGDRLAGNVMDLLATLVFELARPVVARDTTRGCLVRRVRQYINRNLGDPALAPEMIAEAHQISVRYLHRLFEGEGVTVSRLIQRRRLEECGRELARRGHTSQTVSAVAERWGFTNPAHFSRAFRTAYGMSPREWRNSRTQLGNSVTP